MKMAKIILSAQNFDIYQGDNLDPFARTGDTSPEQLKSAGAQGVIIGHSEVGDSPKIIHQKLLTLANKKLLPKTTVLLGESWQEFDGQTPDQVASTISSMTTAILKDIPSAFIKQLVLGYEPKWGSRGSGRDDMSPPTPEFISACVKAIKSQAKTTPVIYGGRSTPERTKTILADDNVAGLILGSACNTIEKTLAIAQAMKKVKGNKPKILHANFKAYHLTESYEDYLKAINQLDNSFTIYLSPPHTDIYKLKQLL